ncbi:M16 family metallopeptidase [Vulgatibacter incomptus]|nr:pitrilysin family protein [Vulgatibacter incomptus]
MRRIAIASTAFALASACATAPVVQPDAATEAVADPEAWRDAPPAPGALADLVTPTFERFVLPNGLTVIVSERHELPLVSINVAFRAGSASDPDGKEGLAQLTYQLLLEGAGKRDALALDDAFADLGSSAFASVNPDGALVGTQVLASNAEAATALLADVVQRPSLDAKSFQRRKEQQLANLAAQVGNPRYLAGEAFAAAVFGRHHPYGRLGTGTPVSVGKLTQADARRFYANASGPKGAAILFAGDITVDQARELATSWFGKWKGSATAAAAPKAPQVTARQQVVFVPKKGLGQTMIMVGRPGLASGDPDEFALDLASTVFGGFFGSRLNMNLREDKGYTYGARAYVEPRRGVGPLVASSAVRADVTGPSLVEVFKELADIKTRPITAKELEAAREGTIRSIPGSFESVGGLASAAASLYWKDLPLDHYARMIEAYENATAADVQRAAEAYFDPTQMQIVLVGDPDVIGAQVPQLGLGSLQEGVLAPAAAKPAPKARAK